MNDPRRIKAGLAWITLKRRPWWKRCLSRPKLIWTHYKILRKGNSRWRSLREAIRLAGS